MRGNDKAKRLNIPVYRAVKPGNASENTPYHRNRGVYRKETIIQPSNKDGSRQAQARRSSKKGEIVRCNAVRVGESGGGPGGYSAATAAIHFFQPSWIAGIACASAK